MQQIHVYRAVAGVTVDEFVQRYPFPFLVHTSGTLKTAERGPTRGLTVDRIMLEGRAQPPKVGDAFLCGELRSRDDNNVVTVGFSSTCDVVINDPKVLATGDKVTFGYVEATFLFPDAFHRLLRGLL